LKKGKKLPPVLLRKYKNGYQILDGHHRYKAYRVAGTEMIPSRIIPPERITGDIDEHIQLKRNQ